MEKGKSLNIYIDNVIVAISTSCEYDHDVDTMEVSSPDTGLYRTYIPGRHSWQISCSWLVKNTTDLSKKIQTASQNKTLEVKLCYTGNEEFAGGTAICTKLKITATRGDLIKGSFVFKGTGEG